MRPEPGDRRAARRSRGAGWLPAFAVALGLTWAICDHLEPLTGVAPGAAEGVAVFVVCLVACLALDHAIESKLRELEGPSTREPPAP